MPRNFAFNTAEDIKKADITFGNRIVNWDSEAGKSLIDTLLVSDNYIKFVIAHELTHIKSKHFIPMTVHASSFCFGAYLLVRHLVASKGSVVIKLLHLHMLAVLYFAYRMTRQKLAHWSEFQADKYAAKLSVDYADGGVDCMLSRLRLNRILQEVNVDKGKVMFSINGDSLQTYTHPKRTDRLKRIEAIKKEIFESEGLIKTYS